MGQNEFRSHPLHLQPCAEGIESIRVVEQFAAPLLIVLCVSLFCWQGGGLFYSHNNNTFSAAQLKALTEVGNTTCLFFIGG